MERKAEYKTVDYDVTRLVQLFNEHDAAIQAFYQAVKQEYDKGDIVAVDALLKVVAGMLIALSQQQERLGWFNEHIKGNA
jgi:hypothetical protein